MSVSLVKLSPVDMYARSVPSVVYGTTVPVDYMAVRPLRSVCNGARVIVPVWSSGEVIGWAPGTVTTVHVFPDERGNVTDDSVTVLVHIDGTAPDSERAFNLYSLQDVDASPNY